VAQRDIRFGSRPLSLLADIVAQQPDAAVVSAQLEDVD
jgi:hypothetical protein